MPRTRGGARGSRLRAGEASRGGRQSAARRVAALRETYDEPATRSGSGRRGYGESDGYGARADADPYERDYDEVVTTLWLPMRDLGLGDVGTDVGMLQQAFGLPPSGVFDKSTAREIARWQHDLGLPKTGYFGVASREAFARAAADARNAERERRAAGHEARGAPRGQHHTGTPSPSYGPRDRPSLDALAPVTTARSGRETYGSAVRVPTDRAPITNTTPSGVGVPVVAVAFVAAAAAAAGAAASRPRRDAFLPRDGRSSFGATIERIVSNGLGTKTKETPLLSRRASLVSRLEGKTKTRASPYDDDGRGFGAPTSPRPPAVRADPSPRGKRGGGNDGASPTSGSLPAKPFYVATSPAPAPAPGARSTDWNARESWSGKPPPPYDELVGFPKQKDPERPKDPVPGSRRRTRTGPRSRRTCLGARTPGGCDSAEGFVRDERGDARDARDARDASLGETRFRESLWEKRVARNERRDEERRDEERSRRRPGESVRVRPAEEHAGGGGG